MKKLAIATVSALALSMGAAYAADNNTIDLRQADGGNSAEMTQTNGSFNTAIVDQAALFGVSGSAAATEQTDSTRSTIDIFQRQYMQEARGGQDNVTDSTITIKQYAGGPNLAIAYQLDGTARSDATLTQIGRDNIAGSSQSQATGSKLFIDQSGDRNGGQVGQFGTGAGTVASISQTGNEHRASVVQTGGSDSGAFVVQGGDGNLAVVVQMLSTGSDIFVNQLTGGNEAYAGQIESNYSQINLTQMGGSGNFVNAQQGFSNGSGIYMTQDGSFNRAELGQVSSNASVISGTQTGMSNQVLATQVAHNNSTITSTQSGSFNRAVLSQR